MNFSLDSDGQFREGGTQATKLLVWKNVSIGLVFGFKRSINLAENSFELNLVNRILGSYSVDWSFG